MALTTLKPKLKAINTTKVKMLEAKAGATQRIRGRAWMETRQRIALAHGYKCAHCGLIWRSHIDQVDHTIPLEQGGSNDDSNLKPLCIACHNIKTKAEATARS
jgi:5-methylcytosine-specific restriction enzyme A